jgi:hypothetical protein
MRAAYLPAVLFAVLFLGGCNREPSESLTDAEKEQRIKAANALIAQMENGKGAYEGTGNLERDLHIMEINRKIDEAERGEPDRPKKK